MAHTFKKKSTNSLQLYFIFILFLLKPVISWWRRKVTSLRGLLFSPRKYSGRVSLDSLEKKKHLMNVYGIMYLSLWYSRPQDECMFNTLPYYITDLFIIAYSYSEVLEGTTLPDVTSSCVPLMVPWCLTSLGLLLSFQCHFSSLPLPPTFWYSTPILPLCCAGSIWAVPANKIPGWGG